MNTSPIGVRVFVKVLEVSGTITAKKGIGFFWYKNIRKPQSELKTLVNVSSIYFLRFQKGIARTIISDTKSDNFESFRGHHANGRFMSELLLANQIKKIISVTCLTKKLPLEKMNLKIRRLTSILMFLE